MHVELIALEPAAAARAAHGDLSMVPAANIAAVAALVQQVAVAYRDLYRRTAAEAPGSATSRGTQAPASL